MHKLQEIPIKIQYFDLKLEEDYHMFHNCMLFLYLIHYLIIEPLLNFSSFYICKYIYK